jgi:hypothetical protein
MDIPAAVARVAHMLGGMVKVLDVIKLRQIAVYSFEGGAHSQVQG